jgi:hypothetical protein
VLFSGYTKILVGLGATTSGSTNNFEVIDLESTTSKCSQVTPYPVALHGSMGGIGMNEKPIVCGGYGSSAHHSECYKLDKIWQTSISLKATIAYGAIAPSPFTNKSHHFILSGGRSQSSSYLNTVDVLKETEWERLSSHLPTVMHQHCMVLMNSTTLITVGGHNANYLKDTYILNAARSPSWAPGPPLKYSRHIHSCSRIRKNANDLLEFSIIAVGGYNNSGSMTSVELLDEGASQWRDGPELPTGIHYAQMVEDPLGGVILIGGSSSTNAYSHTMYRLAHAEEGARWMELPQKLSIGRYLHTAIMVPDNFVNCTIF